MPKIDFERIIKADREKVFSIAANYEEFQKTLPEYFPSIRVRSHRKDTAVVEEHLNIAGKELVMMTKHVTKYPEIHEVFVIGGDAKGTHIVERYQNVPGGTKITVEVEIKLKGKLKILGFLGKNRIKKSLLKIMDEFEKIAEK